MAVDPAVRLDVLHVPDCPNVAPLLDRLREITDHPVTTREIATDAEAEAAGMAGSPTLLVNGVDPFAGAGAGVCGVACRLYRDETGRLVRIPSAEQLRRAITAGCDSAVPAVGPAGLSAWRARTAPLDPDHRTVHQAILRSFAATGRPPTRQQLEWSTRPAAAVVLAGLHDLDAIRLWPGGEIAAAYPFSTTPTRHRVRIDSGVEVYAMCAIDALGISPMLGRDTRIASIDTTNNRPIMITTTGGRTRWQPADAVVFITADAGAGPSADCCCDYLNFFTNHTAAQAWTNAHPHIPGQILTRREAETLAARIFGHLFT
jgi:hypothetical protein